MANGVSKGPRGYKCPLAGWLKSGQLRGARALQAAIGVRRQQKQDGHCLQPSPQIPFSQRV